MNCPHCGSPLAEGQKFCNQCGTPAPSPAPGTPAKKGGKGKVIAIVLAVVLALAAVGVGCFFLGRVLSDRDGGERSHSKSAPATAEETAAAAVEAAFVQGDLDALFDMIPEKLWSYVTDEAGMTRSELRRNEKEEMDAARQRVRDRLGGDYTTDVKVLSTQGVSTSKAELEELSQTLGALVEEGKEVEVEIVYRSEDNDYRERVTVPVVKIDGAWSILPAWGGKKETAAPAPMPEPDVPTVQQSYKVGVCQLVGHVSLDAATQGFMDALNDALPGQVTFTNNNAYGDSATCATIVNSFVFDKADLILANATPALQAAAAATGDIPVLGTCVTDFGAALGIADFTGTVGGNISGTCDVAPPDQQAALVRELFPGAKSVGMLYGADNAATLRQIEEMERQLEKLGFRCVRYGYSESGSTPDLAYLVQAACGTCDVIYVPADSVILSSAGMVADLSGVYGTPVVTGEEGLCAGCGVACLSVSYYDLGYETGRMAAEVLTGRADISRMPVRYAPTATKRYNPDLCARLGVVVPDDYVALD